MIQAQIVAHSINPQGDELVSVLATFPRIVLAEVNTHRMLSKNTSSSRAIPFNKMVEAVQDNPFIPIAWQKEHKGMQGTEYWKGQHAEDCELEWISARNWAIDCATRLSGAGATKQLCNRLLEPFMWTTMLITGSKEGWDNFFELRCPQYKLPNDNLIFKSWKDVIKNSKTVMEAIGIKGINILDRLELNKGQAEIHIMDLAEKIYDAMNESTPKQLKAGEWHISFRDKIDSYELNEYLDEYDIDKSWLEMYKVKISTAMAARTSYTVVGDEKEIDYSKMIGLHDRLIVQNPPHSSPMEHCARAMSDDEYYTFIKGQVGKQGYINQTKTGYNGFEPKESKVFGWCRNFKGFISYRHILETNNN